eukprot:TRINITY_DN20054_c0_g1_i1.p1 TRINITY_DN20054_c0_g1~~TRINITY_DN20054_c0_g1_i1.p1  ORF type:complete len:2118 (-),score=766.83 TRINITY_DN20054_c0_g1_i1:95-6448(-)
MSADSYEGTPADFERYLMFTLPAGVFQVAADKKFVWYNPDPKNPNTFETGEIKKEEGEMNIIAGPNGDEKVNKKFCFERNPAKFDGVEDCGSLAYLNEPSVLHNLRLRYNADVIHTYSGLFLVVVNPYKRLPIYTPYIVDRYRGRRRNELPPHIFAVADEAYRSMLQDRMNQSLLITGESGAGKTENTKKVIQYLAFIAGKTEFGKPGLLEEQLLVANPIMESFGNACTTRNNNSSRFGKFIELQFNSAGHIIGAYISIYLLEKSRVVSQHKDERNYHIFYQLVAGASNELKNKLHLRDATDYNFINQGKRFQLEGVDDAEDFKALKNSLGIMGVDEDDQNNIWNVVAGLLHLGNIEFVEAKDGAELKDDNAAKELAMAAECLGANDVSLRKGLIEPRIKAGTEIVSTHLDATKACAALNALAKAIYHRLFMWMVRKINDTLAQKNRSFIIGVLDIAGFEIFKLNSFEQLCINFTNERLQQFFNHHMFKLEQEEYAREKIEWKFIDFGLDSQPVIDLIEAKTPAGILALLDEQSVFPDARDAALLQKLNQHFGKAHHHPKYLEAQFAGSNSFSVRHYAGLVDYDVTDWIMKNRDPLETDLETCMKDSKQNFVAKLFKEDFGIAGVRTDDLSSSGPRRGAKFITVGGQHKEQLSSLMNTLFLTSPHFVRCILPNNKKSQHLMMDELVLDQLKCNGVLEGIRISRKGYPNRVIFSEFLKRYYLLGKGVPRSSPDSRGTVSLLLEQLQIPKEQYQIGLTKVFFRTGQLGAIEEMRELKISQMILGIQASCRAFISRKRFIELKARTIAAVLIQQNLRAYIDFKNWPWWKLFQKVRPLLEGVDGPRKKIKELEKQVTDFGTELATIKKEKDDQFALLEKTNAEVAGLTSQLKTAQDNLEALSQSKKATEEEKNDLQSKILMLQEDINEYKSVSEGLKKNLQESDETIKKLEDEIAAGEAARKQLEGHNKRFEAELLDAKEQLKDDQETISSLEKLKQSLQKEAAELTKQLTDEVALKGQLEKQKKKLELELDETEGKLESETAEKENLIKAKKQLESQLMNITSNLNSTDGDLKSIKAQLAKTEAELNEYRDKYEQECKARAALEKTKRDLELSNQELTLDLTDMTESKTKLEGKVKSLEKAQSELEKQISEGLDVKQIIDSQRKKMEQEILELKKQIEQLLARVNALEKEKKQLEGELESTKQALAAALSEKAALEKGKKTAEKLLEDTVQKLAESEKARVESERVKRLVEREKAEVEESLEKITKERDDAQSKNKEFEQELSSLRSDQDQTSQQKSNIESRMRSLQQELSLVTGQRDDEKTAREAAESRRKALEEELQIAREAQDVQDEANRKLLRDLKQSQDEAANNLKKSSSDSTERDQLAEKLKNLMKENERLNLENDEIGNKMISLESNTKKLQRSIDEALEKADLESKSRQAAERIKRKLEGDFAALKLKFDALESQNTEQLVQFRTLKDEDDTLKKEIEEQDEKLKEMTKAKGRLDALASSLKEQLESSEADFAKANEKVKDLEAKLAEALASAGTEGGVPLELLQQKVAELEEVRNKLKAEIENRAKDEKTTKELREKLQAAKVDVEVLTQQKEGAEKSKEKMTETLNNVRKENEDINRKCKQIEDENKAMAAENKQLKAKIGVTVSGKQLESEELSRVKATLQSLAEELEKERKEHSESELQLKSIETLNQELKNQLQDDAVNLDRATRGKRQLEIDLEALREENADQEKTAQEVEDEKRKLSLELEDLKKRYDTEITSAGKKGLTNAAYEQEIQKYKSLFEEERKGKIEVERLKKRLEEDVEDFNVRLEKETKEKSESEKARKKLDRDFRLLKTKIDAELSSKSELENQVFKLEEELESLRVTSDRESKGRILAEKARSTLTVKFEEISNLLEAEIKTRSRLEKEKQEIQLKYEEAKEAEEDLETSRLAIDERLNKLEKDRNDLRNELEKERELREQLEDDKEKLLRENNDSKAKANDLEVAKSSFEKTKKRMEQEIEELSVQLEDNLKEKSRIDRERKNAEKLTEELKKKLVDLEKNGQSGSLQKLQIEFKRIQLQNDELELKLKMMTEEKERMLKEFDEEKVKMEEEKKKIEAKSAKLQEFFQKMGNM